MEILDKDYEKKSHDFASKFLEKHTKKPTGQEGFSSDFLSSIRALNDRNQEKYETELKKHGQNQEQMKMMLVKEKI